MAPSTLYVLYNADATVMGKLRYGYRKMTAPKDKGAECSACEITHGGLSLNETPGWTKVKGEIEATGVKVVQWHRDELSDEMRAFLKDKSLGFPAVVGEKDGGFETVMSKDELDGLKGDEGAFVKMLREKGVLSEGTGKTNL